MSALLIWRKVNPLLAIPIGLSLDLGVAYIIAQIIRSF